MSDATTTHACPTCSHVHLPPDDGSEPTASPDEGFPTICEACLHRDEHRWWCRIYCGCRNSPSRRQR